MKYLFMLLWTFLFYILYNEEENFFSLDHRPVFLVDAMFIPPMYNSRRVTNDGLEDGFNAYYPRVWWRIHFDNANTLTVTTDGRILSITVSP